MEEVFKAKEAEVRWLRDQVSIKDGKGGIVLNISKLV
jgi:hypothetical protein